MSPQTSQHLPRKLRFKGSFLTGALALLPFLAIGAWLLASSLLPGAQAAGINSQINYQGKLASSTGAAIANGNYNFRFSLWDDPSAGSSLWEESWSAASSTAQVTSTAGIFSVALGAYVDIPASLFTSDSVYLQVEFDSDGDGGFDQTFAPRKRLTASPYAFNAEALNGYSASTTAVSNTIPVLDGNAGLTVSGVTTTDLAVLGTSNFATLTVTNLISTYSSLGLVSSGTWQGDVIGVAYGGTGTTTAPGVGQILMGNGTGYDLVATSSLGIASSQWTTNGTAIYYNGGNVGIGVTSTSVKLEVDGTVSSTGLQVNGNATVTGQIVGGMNSRFGDAARYWQVEDLDLTSTTFGNIGHYPMLTPYTDGFFTRLGAIANELLIYDKANIGGDPQFTFASQYGAGAIGHFALDVSANEFSTDIPLAVGGYLTVNQGGSYKAELGNEASLSSGFFDSPATDVYLGYNDGADDWAIYATGNSYLNGRLDVDQGSYNAILGDGDNLIAGFFSAPGVDTALGYDDGTTVWGIYTDGDAYFDGNVTTTGQLYAGTLKIDDLDGLLYATNGAVSTITTSSLGLLAIETDPIWTAASASYLTTTSAATLYLSTSTVFGGAASGTYDNLIVLDNSHNHDSTTISNLVVADFASPDISQWTNNVGYITTASATDLYVDAAGDTMSGALIVNNNITATGTVSSTGLQVNGNADISAGSYYRYNGVKLAYGSTTLNNYFFGNAGNLTMTGQSNTAVGLYALDINDSGNLNTAVGSQALKVNSGGSHNTAIGSDSLFKNTTGTSNTAIGMFALINNTTGGGNTAIGYQTLDSNTTGGYNTALGYLASVSTGTLTNATAIGYNALVATSNAMVLGNGSINVGIGVTAPSTALEVAGTVSSTGLVVNGNATTAGQLTVGGTLRINSLNIMFTGSGDNRIHFKGLTGKDIWWDDTNGRFVISEKLTVNGNVTATSLALDALDGLLYAYSGVVSTITTSSLGLMAAGTDNWVDITGDTMTGNLHVSSSYINVVSTTLGYWLGGQRFMHSSGSGNTAVGIGALYYDAGGNNTAMGSGSLSVNVSGSGNTAIGYSSLGANISGDDNTAMGSMSLMWSLGLRNVAVGAQAGANLVSGDSNTFIGTYAGYSITTGTNNIIIGYNTDANGSSSSNFLNIGNTIYGDLTTKNIGIGIATPTSARLEVLGTVSSTNLQVNGNATITSLTLDTLDGLLWANNGVVTTTATSSLGILPSAIDGQLLVYNSGWQASSQIYVATSTGYVGIGTTTPSQQLSITGNFQLPLTTGNTTTPKNGIIYKGVNPFISDFNYGLSDNGTTTAGFNTFVGINAGNLTMGSAATIPDHASYNTAIGNLAFSFNTIGYSNTAIGFQALHANTSGDYNTAVGQSALYANTSGNYNTAIGQALVFNTSGDNNTAMGYNALAHNQTGGGNIAIGQRALYDNTGSLNTALGMGALSSNTSGNNNTAVGYLALSSNTTGTNNTAVGFHALASSTGDNNVALGNFAGSHETGLNSFYVNNVDEGSSANDKLYSLLYGTFSGSPGSLTGQTLRINASTTISQGLTVLGSATTTGRLYVLSTSTMRDIIPDMTGATGNVSLYNLGSYAARWDNLWVKTLNIGTSTWSINNGDDGRLSFYDDDMGIGNERLSILANGNVGIGTTNPGAKLEIAGNMLASGINGFISSPYSIVAPTKILGKGTGALTSIGTVAAGTNRRGITADPTGRFVYVVNGNDTVSMYSINQSTGALTSIGTAATGNDPHSVTTDPTGRFVYVANSSSDDVSKYYINQSTGVLAPIGTPIAAENTPYSIMADPTGRFVYVANYTSGDVSMYSINQSTGALAPIASAIAAGGGAYDVTTDPTGRFVYVVAINSDNVSMYSINQSTGALTSIGTVAAGNDPHSVTTDPTGRFVYVANYSSSTVSMYSINQSTGVLASIGTVAAGTNPNDVTTDPTGRFVYVANYSSSTVSIYSINQSTGVLASIGTVAAGTNPNDVTTDPTGRFVYVANADGNVSMYSIDNFSAGSGSFAGISIGTTSPTAKLQVVDASASTGTRIFVISTSTDVFSIDGAGSIRYKGGLYSDSADYAEYFYTHDTDLSSGEAVCVDVAKDNAVVRCTRAGDDNIMGIISTRPAIVGNSKEGYEGNPSYKIVAMLGQIPAKASTENGEIRPGDYLTAASVPGYIMKAGAGDATVGVALEGLSAGNGTINVMISRRNKSLTVEQVEDAVTQRIADMELEDEVNIMLADTIRNYDFTDDIAAYMNPFIASVDAKLTLLTDTLALKVGELASTTLGADANLSNQILASNDLISIINEQVSTTASNLSVTNEKVEGLDALVLSNTDRITNLELFTSTTIADLQSALADLSVSTSSLQVADNTITTGKLVVTEAADFIGTITVRGEANFEAKVTFKAHVSFDDDTAGIAKIPANATSTEVIFVNPYERIPVITVTPKGNMANRNYWVIDETEKGFRIAVDPTSDTDLEFNWQAIVTVNGRVTEATENEEADIIDQPVATTTDSVSTDDASTIEPTAAPPQQESDPIEEAPAPSVDPVIEPPVTEDPAPVTEIPAADDAAVVPQILLPETTETVVVSQ